MQACSKCEGFTIMELAISMAIFAIGFMAVAGMQIRAVNSTTASAKTTKALELAGSQAEFLQGIPFYDDTLDLDGNGAVEPYDIAPELIDDVEHPVAGDRLPVDAADMDGYEIQWTVDTIDESSAYTGSPLAMAKSILITVSSEAQPDKPLARMEMVKVWELD